MAINFLTSCCPLGIISRISNDNHSSGRGSLIRAEPKGAFLVHVFGVVIVDLGPCVSLDL